MLAAIRLAASLKKISTRIPLGKLKIAGGKATPRE
jgi:hypothetical protein